MEVAALQDWLRARQQKVILLGGGTVGGAIACNASQFPRVREQILGMSVMTSDGAIAVLGGKVMKNVAGYDGTRACIGSKGTLGVILRATLKTFPLSYPEQARPDRRDPLPANEKVQAMVKKAFDPVGRFPSLDEVLS
jgi:D-lactate dehydrogenase (cytochrome)